MKMCRRFSWDITEDHRPIDSGLTWNDPILTLWGPTENKSTSQDFPRSCPEWCHDFGHVPFNSPATVEWEPAQYPALRL